MIVESRVNTNAYHDSKTKVFTFVFIIKISF